MRTDFLSHPCSGRVRAVFVPDSERELKPLKISLKIFPCTQQNANKHSIFIGGEGRNRTPLVADDVLIMPGFIGDSSRLCHYWNYRFPFGLLAILLAIS